MEKFKTDVLNLLQQNSRLTDEEISNCLNSTPDKVRATRTQLEEENIILKYTTVVNTEKINTEKTIALIELNLTPEREFGFDKLAERIYRFPQVKSLYLMSGAYDLAVMIEADSLKEVSLFVSEKLAPLHQVKGTKTHFIMKKYKESGVPFTEINLDKRLVVTP